MKTVLRTGDLKTGNEITHVHAFGRTFLTKVAYDVLLTSTVTPALIKQVYAFPHVILAKIVNDQVEPIEIKFALLVGLGLINMNDVKVID